MRISQREKVLLGYSRPSYDSNSSPKTPNRTSDIDFSDVFGGPPRRASFQEMQNRFYDDNDDDSLRGGRHDETEMGRSSCSSNPAGKPVFGSETVSRRQYRSEDFFDDIFRGSDQSLSSSPRMGGRNTLSPAPGSQVLSPAPSLPPGVEPLGSPARSPAPFSLPARLSSLHSFSASMPRLSGQAVQNLDVFQDGDSFSSYRRSPLSRKASSNGEELKKDGKVVWTGGGTQVSNGGSHFHFSIHKWASKGVPLVMSLARRNSSRSKEKNKLERSLSLSGRVELESDALAAEIQPFDVNNDDLLSFNVHVVSADGGRKESDQIVDKSVSSAPKLRSGSKVESRKSVHPVSEESEDPALSRKSTSTETEEVLKSDRDANKSDMKQSATKLHGKTANDAAVPEVRGNQKQKVVKSKLAASLDAANVASHDEVCKSKSKELSGFKGDKRNNTNNQKNMGIDTGREKVKENVVNDRTREKGTKDMGNDGATRKVKEFTKIFNQEASSKPTADVNGRSHGSSRWINIDASSAETKSTLSSTKIAAKMQGFDVNCRLDSASKVNGDHTSLGRKQFDATNGQETCQRTSIENDILKPTMGSTSDGYKASGVTYESIPIEELPEIVDKSPEANENDEDIQAYESKILEWCKGKEGNIRALLSTLQYVLWPNSGWKPVPLADIIEANAVKRSYQRALLCLHPDKLQQKGAAFHQKFIAEKVFDILQEAWDRFNSLGSP